MATTRGRHIRCGAAIVTALIVALILTMLIGAAVIYSTAHYSLSYAQDRSEAALLLAEGGINDELRYIAQNVGTSNTSSPYNYVNSVPLAYPDTLVYPGDNHPVWGRRGTVDGWPNRYFWVYSSNNKAGTIPWDTKQAPFYITATAYVNGSWRRVQVKANAIDIFSLYAVFALASYPNNSNAIGLQNATVVVTGTAGTNGQVSNSSSTFVATNLINANTQTNQTGQFTNSNLAPGGILYTQRTPVIFPTVETVLWRQKGMTWADLAGNNSNGSRIYTYRPNAASQTISAANCMQFNPGITMLANTSTGQSVNGWANAGFKPGTGAASVTISGATNASPIVVTTTSDHNLNTGDSVTITGVGGNTAANGTWIVTVPNGVTGRTQFSLNSSTGNGTYSSGGTVVKNLLRTLIFEPGDYYFTSINVLANPYTELVIDSQAFASGGFPGQVRFWVHNPGGGGAVQNDGISIPIVGTYSAGLNNQADPTLFRLFYGQDKGVFTFQRPSNFNDYAGNPVSGAFNVYGAVYAVTKQPGDTSSLVGTSINFVGIGGEIVLNGALLADQITFHYLCGINYVVAANGGDPEAGAGVVGGYSDGG